MSSTQIITFQKAENTWIVRIVVLLYCWWSRDVLQGPLPICTFDPPLESVLSMGCVQSGTQKNISCVFPLEKQDGVVPQPPDALLWWFGVQAVCSRFWIANPIGLDGPTCPDLLMKKGHSKALDLWTNCLQEVYTQCPEGWCWPASFPFFWSLPASSALLLRCRDRHIRRNFLHDMTDFGNGRLYSFALLQ